jgi:nucleoside-diphosphate-sugar epimerase
MRILLTGGASDLARVLAPTLISRGDAPIHMDIRPPTGAVGQFIEGSILDRPALQRSIAGCDCVVHIAAWHGIHAVTGQKDVYDFWDLNVTGTFNVFEAAARAGVRRVVYISSTSVDEWPDVYGHTKLLGEQVAHAYVARHGMQVLTLRPRAFIPPWNRAVYDSFVAWARWFWPGAVHIRDVGRAVILAIDALAAGGVGRHAVLPVDGAYPFTDEELERWDADGPGSTFRSRFPEHERLALAHGLDTALRPERLDISETTATLGYRPTYGLAELLAELARYGAAGPPAPDAGDLLDPR